MQCYIPVAGMAGPEDTEGEVWAGTQHSHMTRTLYTQGVEAQGFGTQVVGIQAGMLGTLVGIQTGVARTMVEPMEYTLVKVLRNKKIKMIIFSLSLSPTHIHSYSLCLLVPRPPPLIPLFLFVHLLW